MPSASGNQAKFIAVWANFADLIGGPLGYPLFWYVNGNLPLRDWDALALEHVFLGCFMSFDQQANSLQGSELGNRKGSMQPWDLPLEKSQQQRFEGCWSFRLRSEEKLLGSSAGSFMEP